MAEKNLLNADRLQEVARLAEEYVIASNQNDRGIINTILDIAVTFNALEMANFCWHILRSIDSIDDGYVAAEWICVLTTRLGHTPVKP